MSEPKLEKKDQKPNDPTATSKKPDTSVESASTIRPTPREG